MNSPLEMLKALVSQEVDDWAIYEWVSLPEIEASEFSNHQPDDPIWTEDWVVDQLVQLIPGATPMTPHLLKLQNCGGRLLDREITPMQFCQTVNDIDNRLIEHGPDYPSWFRDLHSACDWCDESWTIDNSDCLKHAVESLIRLPVT